MNPCYLHDITVTNFRNHIFYNTTWHNSFNVIIGPNGIGKTALLEAASLLYPGNGIRDAGIKEISNRNKPEDGWFLEANVLQNNVINNITVAYKNAKKRVSVNNKPTPTQRNLLNYTTIIHVSPGLHNKIPYSITYRRKFFDKIVYFFEHDHADNYLQYEKALNERNNLLRNNIHDNNWLDCIEENIAEYGSRIMYARYKILHQVNRTLHTMQHFTVKPYIIISEKGYKTSDHNIASYKNNLRTMLADSRAKDFYQKRTGIGPHTTVINIMNGDNLPISSMSSGEQKISLVKIVSAQSEMCITQMQTIPIMLIDDMTAQLDDYNIGGIYQRLADLNCQVFITCNNIPCKISSFNHKIYQLTHTNIIST